jgi:hypothetical protein
MWFSMTEVFPLPKFTSLLSVVVHICNAIYLGGRDRGIAVQGQSRYKILSEKNKLKVKGLEVWFK